MVSGRCIRSRDRLSSAPRVASSITAAAKTLSRPTFPGTGPARVRKGCRQVEQPSPKRRVSDRVISVHERRGFGAAERLSGRWVAGLVSAFFLGLGARHRRIGIFVEELDRNIQHSAKREKTARADAVDAAFVFLHLLEAHAEPIGKPFLGDMKHEASLPHARPDMDIDGIERNA